jgi:hypothetical protein
MQRVFFFGFRDAAVLLIAYAWSDGLLDRMGLVFDTPCL